MAPWERGSSVQDRGGAPWAWWRYLLISFLCLEDRFLTFCANWPSCTDHFLHPFWNGLEGFGRLGGFWSPLTVHSCFLASFLSLLCMVLFPGSTTRIFALEKWCPTSSWPFLQSLFSLFFPTPCYYQQSFISFTARGCRDAVQVSGPAAVQGTHLVQAVGCSAGALECPVQSPKPPSEEGGTLHEVSVGEGLHCKHSNTCLSHANKLFSQQVAPLKDSISPKSLFIYSPIW